MRRIARQVSLSNLTLLIAGTLSSCAAGPARVSADAEAQNRSSEALSTGVLQWANGTYGSNCVGNANGNWSLAIAGSPSMDYPALTVVQDNTTCVLTLTSLVTNESTKTTYAATPAITLGGSYAASASAFSSGSGLAFYGNAMMNPADFSSNLTVTILYSDNPNLLAPAGLTGVYASITTASVTQSITSPNYALDLATGALTVTVDANFNVESVTGTAILDSSTVVGNSYYVDQGTLVASPTFAQLDSAYSMATTTSISGTGNVTINASALGLTSASLSSTVYRTIVIQRLVSGVASYETVRIGFSHP